MKVPCLLALMILTIQDGAPINANCSVRNKPVNASVTSTHDGKTIGFCCKGCKGKFDAAPEQYLSAIPELKKAPAQGETAKAEVGKKAPDFTLPDTDGKSVKLSDHKGKIVVLHWINPDCPVCKRTVVSGLVAKMLEEIKAINKDAVVLPISTTHNMDASKIAAYLKDNKIELKGLMDNDGKVGRMYDAKTTPHMYVIDAEGVLRYNGAIDDDPKGKGGSAKNYVVNAIKQLTGNEKVSPDSTKPYGCSVKYKN